MKRRKKYLLSVTIAGLLFFTVFTILGNGLALAMNEESLPDISGKWTGKGWGEVILEKIGPVSYAGTYSDTHKRDVGRITFSFVAGKFEGKWWEGDYRLGPVTLEASQDGRTITGRWSASPASIINPGKPSSETLRWNKK
jgi:hypothetical protein